MTLQDGQMAKKFHEVIAFRSIWVGVIIITLVSFRPHFKHQMVYVEGPLITMVCVLVAILAYTSDAMGKRLDYEVSR